MRFGKYDRINAWKTFIWKEVFSWRNNRRKKTSKAERVKELYFFHWLKRESFPQKHRHKTRTW